MRARASAYGEPFAYRPEDRPFMAVDGDPATAWRVADRAPAEGEFIRLDVAEPIDHVTLRQPAGAAAVRHIGEVTRDRRRRRAAAGDARRAVARPRGPARRSRTHRRVPATVTITIESVVVPDPTIGPALAAVGFAEIDVGLDPTVEVVRPPGDPRSRRAPGVVRVHPPADAPDRSVARRSRSRRWSASSRSPAPGRLTPDGHGAARPAGRRRGARRAARDRRAAGDLPADGGGRRRRMGGHRRRSAPRRGSLPSAGPSAPPWT